MTELKTLEDLRNSKERCGMDWVYIDEVRRELGIKWVKAIRKEEEEIAKLPTMHNLDEKRFPLLKYHGAKDWIIHNFNITDKDLK